MMDDSDRDGDGVAMPSRFLDTDSDRDSDCLDCLDCLDGRNFG